MKWVLELHTGAGVGGIKDRCLAGLPPEGLDELFFSYSNQLASWLE